ncbi:MAG: NADP-dependent oxidoreductase [Proteobacteria bacterium]|nr:NADP-dependent oxidoreductase [Pseudomonadota bacterium]
MNRQWLYAKPPTGRIGVDTFQWRETAIPAPRAGEVLVRTRMLSLDPANRAWMMGKTYRDALEPGQVMSGFAIGEVVDSTVAGFAKGDLVEGDWGWQEYAALPAARLTRRTLEAPLELLVGPLSVTGLTAYFGLLEVGRPKPGDTVLVSAAAGAVGTMVGQIAKLAGCRVVGTAGGQDKCDWLTRDLGFDAAVDYKAGGVRRALAAACPGGIDVYFDNTGGAVLEAALSLMNLRGRIVCCGNVSQYDVDKPAPGPMAVPGLVVTKRLRLEGFIVMDFYDRRAEAEARLARWVSEGRIKAVVDVVEGLEKAPEALIGLFAGRNRGKMAVRV